MRERGVKYDSKVSLSFFFFLAVPHSMWDPSSPTWDRTCTPCSGSAGSQPLDHQGSPDSKVSDLSKQEDGVVTS